MNRGARRWLRPVRWLEVGLAVLAVLAVTTSLAALDRPGPVLAGPPVVSPTASPDAVKSLWFGDSIIEGCCRSRASSPTMAQVAAAELGWAQPEVVGVGGTGYLTARTSDGTRVGPYTERIEAAVSGASFDVVVIAGGNNDANEAFDPERFRAAVRSVLEQVTTRLPDAELVVLGPYSPTGRGYVAQRRVLYEEAVRSGARLVDQVARRWMAGREDLLDADGFHPNDAGQRHLGVQAAGALRQVLPRELTDARPTSGP